jgi:hypothetical protein
VFESWSRRSPENRSAHRLGVGVGQSEDLWPNSTVPGLPRCERSCVWRRLCETQGGSLAGLPESPQHRAWRNAHTTATQEIARFRNELTDELEAALALLSDAAQPVGMEDATSDVGPQPSDRPRSQTRMSINPTYAAYARLRTLCDQTPRTGPQIDGLCSHPFAPQKTQKHKQRGEVRNSSPLCVSVETAGIEPASAIA